MRHFFALILLSVFAFQVLPIRELGKLLSKSTLTEELADDCGDDCNGECEDGEPAVFKFNESLAVVHHDFPLSQNNAAAFFTKKVKLAIAQSDLKDQHSPDIFAPPPNCIA